MLPFEGAELAELLQRREELAELLQRREELLVAEERAAVQAALEAAAPEERDELERLLRNAPGVAPCGGGTLGP